MMQNVVKNKKSNFVKTKNVIPNQVLMLKAFLNKKQSNFGKTMCLTHRLQQKK